MRVAILSIEFPPGPGGVGTLAYQAARHLSERGWQVAVMTPQDHVALSESERFNLAQPFDIRHLSHVGPPAWEGIRRLAVALWAVRKRRPDVVLAIGMQAVWLGAMLCRMTGLPLVAVGIGSEFGSQAHGRSLSAGRIVSAGIRALNRWAFGYAHRTIAISEYTRKLVADGGLGAAQVAVVPCGADADRYRPGLETSELRARLGIGDSRVLLTVGQLSERKAQDVVIRALLQVLQSCPNVVYVLAGLPTCRAELGRLAADLGVAERVITTSIVPADELPVYYNLADVFVLVSRRTARGEVEGYGIVVAEAALCGVPAVVSAACGIAESASENGAALVVEPNDPPATARAILRLLTDDALRTKMGNSARRYVLETGTWAQRIARYDQVLQAVARRTEDVRRHRKSRED